MLTRKELQIDARRVLHTNRNYDGNHTYTVPDRSRHNVQFFWDSCLIAIGLANEEPEVAKSEIRSLISGQWITGKIPHTVHLKGAQGYIHRHFYGMNSSWILQPPIIAWAIRAIWEKTHDKVFLGQVFPKLVKYYEFIAIRRCIGPQGLMVIYHPWETGADDSPRFDPLMWTSRFRGRSLRVLSFLPKLWLYFRPLFMRGCWMDARMQDKRKPFLIPADMNFFLVENLYTMAELALILEETQKAEQFRDWGNNLKKAMLRRMKVAAFFVDLDPQGTPLLSAFTPFSLLPFLYGWGTKEDQRRAVQNLKEFFFSPYPVPTVSVKEKTYDPNGYWRGTTWVNINWIVIQGLKRIGQIVLAEKLTERTLNMVAENDIFEHYNSETGKGLGAQDFSWTAALVIDFLHQN